MCDVYVCIVIHECCVCLYTCFNVALVSKLSLSHGVVCNGKNNLRIKIKYVTLVMFVSIVCGRLKSHLKRCRTPRALRVASARSLRRNTSWNKSSAAWFDPREKET